MLNYISGDFKSIFHVFPSILLFFGRDDVKWRSCISMLRSSNIMTQVYCEGIYFGAQHVLGPANNSSLARHTKVILCAIWANPKSWAQLVTPPFPKTRGVWSTPKRYVGHMGLESKPGAHPGASRTCAPFAPTMSVRIFGHFWPFSIFLARCALCSAPPPPPCTLDAWTNGPKMVCCLCILVPVTHMPRGRTEAPTHKELAQGECGRFYHFGTCGLNSGHHHAMAHGDLWEPSTCGPTLDWHWVPHQMFSPVSKPSWSNTLGDTFIFGSFSGMPYHPLEYTCTLNGVTFTFTPRLPMGARGATIVWSVWYKRDE